VSRGNVEEQRSTVDSFTKALANIFDTNGQFTQDWAVSDCIS